MASDTEQPEREQDEPQAAPPEAPAAPDERRDEAGVPLDRAPTLDDVRGNDGTHSAAAIGCTVVVLLLVLGFWAVRALWLR